MRILYREIPEIRYRYCMKDPKVLEQQQIKMRLFWTSMTPEDRIRHSEKLRVPRKHHGLSKLPEYFIWYGMKTRCYNPHHVSFPLYGGRGIKVCDQWLHDVVQFLKDVGRRPSPLHSLDRLDNDGNYEPGNVKWSTAAEQMTNRRRYSLLIRKFPDEILRNEFVRRGLVLKA